MKTLELDLKKKVFIVDTTAAIEAIEIDDYKFLCKGSELTEEIASEFMSDFDAFNEFTLNYEYLKNFIYMITSKGFHWLENPIPEPEIQGGYAEDGSFIGGYDDNWIKEWQEAEEKTFKNPLIFVRKSKNQ